MEYQRFFYFIPAVWVIFLLIRLIRRAARNEIFTYSSLTVGIAAWMVVDSLSIPTQPSDLPGIQSEISGYLFLIAFIVWEGVFFLLPGGWKKGTYLLRILIDLGITSLSLIAFYHLSIQQPLLQYRGPLLPPEPETYIYFDFVIAATVINLGLLADSRNTRRFFLYSLILSTGLIAEYLLQQYSQISESILPSAMTMVKYLIAWPMVVLLKKILSDKENEYFEDEMLIRGLAIPARIQSTLPLALPIILVSQLFVSYQMGNQIETQVYLLVTIVWLLLIVRLGVSSGEYETQNSAILSQFSAEPAFLCDQNYKLIAANPGFQRLIAHEPNVGYGKPIRSLVSPLPDPVKIERIYTCEAQLSLLNRDPIPVEISLRQIRVGLFSRQLVTGAIHDLTAQKEQQEQLRSAYEHVSRIQAELQQLNEDLELRVAEKTRSLSQAYVQLEDQNIRLQSLDQMKSDFVSLVSHELRAPLTNISGGIELVLSARKPLSESTRQSLETVQTEIKRLTRLVESILDLSMLDAGKMPLYPEAIPLSEMVADLRQHYQSAPSAGRIRWDFADDLPPVTADRQALMGVFLHVIDNAIKYAPEGEIVVSAVETDGRVICSISDHGAGIPPDVLEQIFDQFFRVENSDARVIYGHGLGLYMARKMLQAMDGDIRGANRPGGGAQFDFWVPIAGSDNG